MHLQVRFPVFVIATREGVLVLAIDDSQCVLLFETRELAKSYLQQVTALGISSLEVLEIPDAQALREGLESLPVEVPCALLDSIKSPEEFEYVKVQDLLQMLEHAR